MKYAQGLWILSQTSLDVLLIALSSFLDSKHISLLLYVCVPWSFGFCLTLLTSARQTAPLWWQNCDRQFQSHVSLLWEESSLYVLLARNASLRLIYEPTSGKYHGRVLGLLGWKCPLQGLPMNMVKTPPGMYYGHTPWPSGGEYPLQGLWEESTWRDVTPNYIWLSENRWYDGIKQYSQRKNWRFLLPSCERWLCW